MTTLFATAHVNELTEDIGNDFYLLPQLRGTLTLADIIKRMEAREIATKNVNGEAFTNLVLDEIGLATLEGFNVVTSLFHTSINMKGVVYAQDLGHNVPADRVNLRIHFAQGVNARAIIKEATVHVAEQPAAVGPVIQAVTNPVVGEPNTLNTGAMALIQGLRIAVRGNLVDQIGVYFASTDGSYIIRVAPGQISPNTPSKLQFVLPPEVTAGQWMVRVATQSSSKSNVFTREVREYTYPEPVTVV